MRFKRVLACILSAGMMTTSLSGALTGAALEAGQQVTFEAEESLVAT